MSFKRRDLSVGEKLAILEEYDLMPQMSQREAAIRLGLSQPLLCRLLRTRYDIESASADVSQYRKRRRTGKDGEVEAALKNWYLERMQLGDSGHLTGDTLKRKAEEIARNSGKPGFVATNGWFQRWRKRENILTGRSREDRSFALFDSEDKLAHESQGQQNQRKQQQPEDHLNQTDILSKDGEIKISEDLRNQIAAPLKPSADPIKQEPAENYTDVPHSNTNQPNNTGTPPTADEMRQALDVLRRGVLHYDRTNNIPIHSAYTEYIETILRSAITRNRD